MNQDATMKASLESSRRAVVKILRPDDVVGLYTLNDLSRRGILCEVSGITRVVCVAERKS